MADWSSQARPLPKHQHTLLDGGKADVDEEMLLHQIQQIKEKRMLTAKARAVAARAREKLAVAKFEAMEEISRADRQKTLAISKLESALDRHALQKFQRARRLNPTNDCFHIWHDGPFGTINGLRLGNYGGKVPWTEINAALGTSALLLMTLATRPGSNFRFSAYDIVPMGSFTKIATRPRTKGDYVTVYNLYSDDSFQLFGKRNFNFALNGFLQCLKETGDAAALRDCTMAFPYPIELSDQRKGVLTIGGLSISYEHEGEIWTRALKYFLADLKWLAAFTTKNVDR
mmetsp:Transcript_5274/g.7722  ORF Transcript_5274/g.7722 Transcript_5274/m.7722 type:complete len:287 (-) Transcript_5274:356-1216(-)|eukprot:CAMPEP_0116005782 /NCGR_PEP_ID=MMETSP0321-20121206/1355_1 /TAXON_ID=163516 /ORGANISM="Leptocylindrus danicus var. danicus, Strain B650" /LENGTH=286 /DNA_ID=CAMNT_0003474245 /DNA_START=11 /DNA_END=871 /DNA_ORIENTATION=-